MLIGLDVSYLLVRNSKFGIERPAGQHSPRVAARWVNPIFDFTISRGHLLAAVLIFASVNGLAPVAIKSVLLKGWQSAFSNTFGVSVIVWGAWASACTLAVLANDERRVGRLEIIIAGVIAAIVAIPVSHLTWLSLSLFSAYVFCTSPKGSLQQRSATIFFAICVPMLWGPALLASASTPLLKIDAFLVSTLVGTTQSGNVVTFVDGVHSMQIWPACSSFHNISQAALAWVALSQTLGRDLGRRDFFWAGLAVSSAAGINLGRLSLMAVSPEYFEMVHGPLGVQIAGGLTIFLIVSVCIVGQRRELFASA